MELLQSRDHHVHELLLLQWSWRQHNVLVKGIWAYRQFRARRALTLFIGTILRTRRVLLLYKVCGTIQWFYLENQKGAIVVQSLWYYSMVLLWEPEGCYCCTKSVVLFNGIILRTRRVLLLYKVCGTIQWYHFENQKGAIVVQSLWYYSMVSFWETEGCYCCTKSVVLFNGSILRTRRVLLLYKVCGTIQWYYFENQKGAIVVQSLWYYSMVLFWEPEGCYCCTKSVVLFNGIILRTRRVLLLYKVCGTIQWYYFENQKGAIVVQSLWYYFHNQKGAIVVQSLWYYSMVLFWEPEGCYCCTKSVVLFTGTILRTRRVLLLYKVCGTIFNGTILRTRRVLLLYKVCGTIQWYYFENQKGAIVVQSLWWYHPSGSQRNINE